MKTQLKLSALPLLSFFILHPSSLLAQGSLTPPGAPAETMKSLDQIEPRTPISAAPFTISNSGSYYLTANLTVTSGDAITIATNGVTLDLNGFTITSSAASAEGSGILLNSGLGDITICNGHIRSGVTNDGSGVYKGSGFGSGISYSGTAPVNVLVSRVSVAGCLYYGIFLYGTFLNTGDSTVVQSCSVRTVGSLGIVASTIKQSVAKDCGNSAIYGEQLSDCRGESTSGDAVYAITTALNCYGQSSSSIGVYASTAQNCYGRSFGNGPGVRASTAQDCYGISGLGFGVTAITAQNCCGSSSSYFGVHAGTASGCYGESSTGTGLYAMSAAFCTAYSYDGTAINAIIANSCYAISGTNIITYKYNMP